MGDNEMRRRDFLAAAGAVGLAATTGIAAADPAQRNRPNTGKNAVGLAAPKLDKVRTAFIGVGARGSGHVVQMMMMEGVEVVAICDNHVPTAQRAVKSVTDKGRAAPALYTNGDQDFKRMLDRDDIDIVIIATPWEWHAPMALDAMRKGKHAFIEVPMGVTMEELWQLVETSEKTQKHCMMMENVNYGREELMVLNMCRLGVFGELLHGEAAYIHDLRWQMNEVDHGTGSWRTLHYAKRNGNLYPTHGLGPVAHYMDVNRGDRMEFLSSMSSNARVRDIFAREHFPEGHKWRKMRFQCGDINTSIIKTAMGKTIMVQWDEQLPRPYTRHNFVQGTKGCWGGFPARTVVEGISKSTDDWEEEDALKAYYDKYDHPVWKKVGEEAVKAGGHGGMDFVMLWRIVYCLRNGLPLDQDVYDGAAWSAVGPLSEASVRKNGQLQAFPDFTRGLWKGRKPHSFA